MTLKTDMKTPIMDFDSTSVVLANSVAKIMTYFDVLHAIMKSTKESNNKNSFWKLTYSAYYDLIILESFKLIDKKNLSLFYLINLIKQIQPDKIEEFQKDYDSLNKIINNKDFTLPQHRHTLKAHHSKRIDMELELVISAKDMHYVLSTSEALIKKYNRYVKGDKYKLDFSSIYCNGHKGMIDYVSHIIKNN
jgi:hypothetical protein